MTQESTNTPLSAPERKVRKQRTAKLKAAAERPVRQVQATHEEASPVKDTVHHAEAHKAEPRRVQPLFAVPPAAEHLHNHFSQQGHALFAENVRLSKDFFKCKTFNDVLELQSRIFHLNSTAYLNNIVKLTEPFLNSK